MSAKQVAAALGLSETTIFKLVRDPDNAGLVNPLRAQAKTVVGRLENLTPADNTLLDILEAHGVRAGQAEAVLLGRRHDQPSTRLDTAKFWNPTLEKIVSALPSADAEAVWTGREPAAFYDALSQIGAPS